MKTSLIRRNALTTALLAAYLTGGGGIAFAAETVTSLSLGSTEIKDIGGEDFAFAGAAGDFKPTAGCVITNSSTTLATVTFEATSGKWNDQFQKVTFGGNLKLVVKGDTSSNLGFQNVSNTHTGGTVFDGYGNDVNNTQPRFNTDTALQSAVIVNNDSYIHFIKKDSKSYNLEHWTSIGTTEGTGYVTVDLSTTVSAPWSIAKDAKLKWSKQSDRQNFDGDMTGIEGTLAIGGSGALWIRNAAGLAKGILEIGDAVTVYHREGQASSTEWGIGALAGAGKLQYVKSTLSGVTEPDVMPLKLGGANVDATYAGNIAHDSSDWAIEKVGTGTQTLTATNTYRGATTLTGGTLMLDDLGTLDYHREKSIAAGGYPILFNGGTLGFGANFKGGLPLFDSFYSTNGNPVKIYTDCDIDSGARDPQGITNGITKLGSGVLTFNKAFTLTCPVRVEAGLLAVTNNSEGVTNTVYVGETGTLHLKTRHRGNVLIFRGDDVSGTGTIRLEAIDCSWKADGTYEKNPGGWRVYGDWGNFAGTLEFAGNLTTNQTNASGLMKEDKDHIWKNISNLDNVTLVYSYNPPEDLLVDKGEVTGDLTLGALQILYPHAIVTIGTARKTITFGAKEGSESILNGQITNRFTLVKTGNTPLTIGSGFRMLGEDPSGYEGKLSVQSGTLVADADLSGNIGCTIDIRSGVTVSGAGTGTVTATQLATAGNYTVKATDGAALTVAGTVNLDDVTIDLDLTGVPTDEPSTQVSYTLLTATEGLTGTPTLTDAAAAAIAALNTNMVKGHWKVSKSGNSLLLTYVKNGLVIIMR